jgi:hypothetical protein
MMILNAIILYIGLSIVVAIAANTRGRSAGGWFLCAILFSPLLGGLVLLALPNLANSFAAGPVYLEGELEERRLRRRAIVARIGAVVLVIVAALMLTWALE